MRFAFSRSAASISPAFFLCVGPSACARMSDILTYCLVVLQILHLPRSVSRNAAFAADDVSSHEPMNTSLVMSLKMRRRSFSLPIFSAMALGAVRKRLPACSARPPPLPRPRPSRSFPAAAPAPAEAAAAGAAIAEEGV